jgi:hypothetical protein
MARRLHLHVGTIKSATTYVQAVCDTNVDQLAERGLLWLGAAANFSAVADLYGTTRPGEYGAEAMAWPTLVKRVDEHEGDALVSNELLSLRGPTKIGLLFDSLPPVEAHVVISARDLARVTVSQWQERARHRPTGPWEEFMARLTRDAAHDDPDVAWFWRRQDLPRLVRAWAAKVGIENVTVVTVPLPGSPAGLFGDRFFGAVGIDDADSLTVPTLTQNQSLGTRSLELIRRVQERLDDADRERLHLVLKYVLTRRVLAERAADEPALTLSDDQLAWAREQAARMADGLRALSVRVVGDLDELVPADAAQQEPVADVSDAELLEVAVDALIGLVDATDELARRLGSDRYGPAVRAVAGRGRGQP